jgi:transposase
MNDLHYIGFDVHKKSIQYCVKLADGRLVREGRIAATHSAVAEWLATQHTPWKGALEATMFSAWIYDQLLPHAVELHVAHSAMLKALATGKHASDRLDARKIADLLRANCLPSIWMAPPELRSLRLLLRYRQLTVRQTVQIKNRIASTLMELGVDYDSSRLHGKRYYQDLLARLGHLPPPVRWLLELSRGAIDMFATTDRLLLRQLAQDAALRQRVARLQTIPGVGQITALTWALETGDPHRFPNASHAMSYCGLVAALQESAGKRYRQPLSRKRNAHLQTMLIEAAHLAPRYHPHLRALYEKVKAERHSGAAAVAVARKLTAYLLAVDKSGQPFELRAVDPPRDNTASPAGPPSEALAVARQPTPSRVRSAAAAPLTGPGARRAVANQALVGAGGEAPRRSSTTR